MPSTESLDTLSRIAHSLKVTTPAVCAAVDQLGLRPAVYIEGRAFYSLEQCKAIEAEIKKQD